MVVGGQQATTMTVRVSSITRRIIVGSAGGANLWVHKVGVLLAQLRLLQQSTAATTTGHGSVVGRLQCRGHSSSSLANTAAGWHVELMATIYSICHQRHRYCLCPNKSVAREFIVVQRVACSSSAIYHCFTLLNIPSCNQMTAKSAAQLSANN